MEDVKNYKETQLRFSDAIWFDPSLEIIIAGLGGTGSHISYVLSRQGYTSYLYDFDTIEVHNIGSQMFNESDIGKKKTEVAAIYAASFGNSNYNILGKFTEESPVGNIVFSCFDNMEARKLLFSKWEKYQLSKTSEYRKENPNEVNIFIDSRMTAEELQVYAVKTKKEIEVYKTTLFDDSEVQDAPCSYKATCQTGTMIASIVSILFLNHVSNKKIGDSVRATPFCVNYSNAGMIYETLNVNEYVKLQNNK